MNIAPLAQGNKMKIILDHQALWALGILVFGLGYILFGIFLLLLMIFG